MRLGIKGKQIAGVTAIVGIAMMTLSALYVTRVAGVVLHESQARGQLLSNAIFHRAREVVTDSAQPYEALRADPGLRAILESSIYSESVTGAVILDTSGLIIASSDPTREGLSQAERPDRSAGPQQRANSGASFGYPRSGSTERPPSGRT